MDVELQMEASGLPTQFASTSDKPEESLIADNLAASISNSEATVNPAPTKQPTIDATQPESVKEVLEAVAEAVPLVPAEEPATNGNINRGSEPVQIPPPIVPDSQPQESLDITSTAPAVTTSISDSHLTESFIPSSIPSEIPSSATPLDTSQPSMDISELQPVPVQAPVSDLRTAPHADALTPEAVAKVEAQKHELDNSADLPVPPKADVLETPLSLAPPAGMIPDNIGLPSPPTQSPPPAPRPVPAALPEQQPSEPSPETSQPRSPIAALPLEEPREPAPTPSAPAPSEPIDQVMTDAPAPLSKQVHQREEDAEEDTERAAKRVKTDELTPMADDSQFKIPEVPAQAASSPATPNGDIGATTTIPTDGDDSVTPPRLAHMKKVISNLKKSNASSAFRVPVDPVALNIPKYFEIVKHPMDLGTIDQRLKRNEYSSIAAFVVDFELIVNNCYTFNGPEHGVSQQAKKMKQSFDGQMRNLPKASIEEPSKEVKKAAKKVEPTRTAPPRRPSVSTSTIVVAPAGSPNSAAPPTPAFAPNPDGMPLIRRDSSFADGRPKRAIVPTKRNSEFGGGRPRKKKYELQLRFCEEVLKEIMQQKHWQANQYFMTPVDPVALNIPTYFQIIKKPMDLTTIKQKLANNAYEKAKDFEEDVRLIFKNCFRFNPDGDLVHNSGRQLEDLFNQKWATKEDWLAAREPPSVTQSDVDDDDDDEDEEESEDDGHESEEERNEKIKKLQAQIAEMSKQMGELTQKKPKKSRSPTAANGKKKEKKPKKDRAEATVPRPVKDKKDSKKKSAKKQEKDRYVTFAEKQYISNGIAMLPEKQMQEALRIIQQSVPSLANSDQSEIELDIEEVPNAALLKLLGFVKKYAGPPPDEPKAEPTETYHAPATTKSKKSKPMSKHEQEAQIEELRGRLGAYTGPISPNAVQSIETGDSSDDDDNSEESEEE